MEATLILLIGGGIIGYLLSRQSLEGWKAAAELCGLEDVEVHGWTRTVKARAGQLEVRFGHSADEQRPTRITVAVPGPPGFQDVSLRPAPMTVWKPDIGIQTGDLSFDRSFVTEGPAELVSALLDRDLRLHLSRLHLEWQFELSSGKLRANVAGEQLFDVLPSLIEIGRLLARPLDLPRRLAENASRDAVPGVRLHNLLLLIRELPADPRTAEAIRRACSDPSPEIRLRAARKLGAEARGVLLELAEKLEDDAVSAEAVSALERELPFERTRAILERALRGRHVLTARVCMEAIGRGGDPAAVELLGRVLEQEYGYLAPTAAWALGATGSPAAEPALIAVLQRDDEILRVAAANALGRVGSAAAVLPLKELADRFLPGAIRKAARQAIAEIQSRIQGASPGQLSLAGADAGQLSLAEGEAGRLSLAGGLAGQLSLGEDEDRNARGEPGPRS